MIMLQSVNMFIKRIWMNEWIIIINNNNDNNNNNYRQQLQDNVRRYRMLITLTMSAVLSKENLTPTMTPVITMATITAHVTAMITCFRETRDFLPSPVPLPGSTWHKQNSNKNARGGNSQRNSVIAARWVGRNSGPIFLRLMTNVHEINVRDW